LVAHAKASGQKLEYRDPQTNEVFTPHVIEPTWGVDRSVLAVLTEAYTEEDLGEGESRIVMKFDPKVAPVKVAILPLMKKDGMAEKAQEIYEQLAPMMTTEYDEGGSIGKRYRRQDEIGTPYCVTVDYDTLEKDDAVTVRDRDSMIQERVKIVDLAEWLEKKLG
jgi:glycyl-tRNA synthetase